MKINLQQLLALHSDAAPHQWMWSEKLPREVYIPRNAEDGGRTVMFYRLAQAALAADSVNALPRLIEIALAAENFMRCADEGQTMTGAMNRLRTALEDDDG